MSRCTDKCAGVCAQVFKCQPACKGTWRQIAWALLVELLPPPPNPVCLAAQIWNGRQCEEITISSSERSYRNSHALSLCSAPRAGCACCHCQGPGLGGCITCQGRGCWLPGPGATGTLKGIESDWGGCGLAKEQGALEGMDRERWPGQCWLQRPQWECSSGTPKLILTGGSGTAPCHCPVL